MRRKTSEQRYPSPTGAPDTRPAASPDRPPLKDWIRGRGYAAPALDRKAALSFVVLMGVVSLFADMTYEGARSIAGPFLSALGASGLVVGAVAGGGELAGYTIRLLSGRAVDRTGRIWAITFAGYGVNLVAVPLLALAGNWPVAAALMIAERVGKGVRVPPRDTMLSHAAAVTGRGWGFGLHEALDQAGAVLGPLTVAAALAAHGGYHSGFAVLAVPAVCALAVLAVSRLRHPHPRAFEDGSAPASPATDRRYPAAFWWYLGAASLFGAGFADFALIAFHFEHAHLLSQGTIPVLYAVAMGVDALAALALGRLFDRHGIGTLGVAIVLGAFFAPLVFSTSAAAAIAGMVLWGVGMGSQESIMRAVVAEVVPPDRRASAYGVFNIGFGLSWFAGSAVIGALYDLSRPALMVFSVLSQLLALPLLLRLRRALREP